MLLGVALSGFGRRWLPPGSWEEGQKGLVCLKHLPLCEHCHVSLLGVAGGCLGPWGTPGYPHTFPKGCRSTSTSQVQSPTPSPSGALWTVGSASDDPPSSGLVPLVWVSMTTGPPAGLPAHHRPLLDPVLLSAHLVAQGRGDILCGGTSPLASRSTNTKSSFRAVVLGPPPPHSDLSSFPLAAPSECVVPQGRGPSVGGTLVTAVTPAQRP